MGDVVKRLPVRSYGEEKTRSLNFYFDTGSPYTFVKKSAAKKFKAVAPLPVPHTFKGLGNGGFAASHFIHIEVKLLGFWCLHYGYVIEDSVLDEDVLAGHDFMQKFDIKLNLKNKDLILSRVSLKRAQKVRKTTAITDKK